MPRVTCSDGVGLYYEEAGEGTPIVFVHEFAGDHRSWEPQLRYFARRYRCIAYAARGYPPSDVPQETSAYSQDRARDDIRDLLGGLGLDRAHVVGLSMGGFAALHFAMAYPQRLLSLTVAGCGHGAEPDKRAQFAAEADAAAARLEETGMAAMAASYAETPARVQFRNKDRRGWMEFRTRLAEHSATGSAATLRGIQKQRPSLYELTGRLAEISVPTLILAGDEDWSALEPSILLKRTIASAGLAILPNSGHTLNLEEPAAFNALLADFLAAAEAGRWPRRDPTAMQATLFAGR